MSATNGDPAGAGGMPQPGGDAHGAGPATTTGGGDSILITVNRKDYEAPKPDMTGMEIKEMADAPRHHALILVAGDPDGGPGEGGGRPVPDDESVHLVRGMRFRTVNRAEFGLEARQPQAGGTAARAGAPSGTRRPR